MLFRDKLRELREKAGLTQEALARAAEMSVGNVRNYEQGIRMPAFTAVVRLAKAVGVDCTAFAGCDDVAGQAEEPEPPAAPKGSRGGAGKRGKGR